MRKSISKNYLYNLTFELITIVVPLLLAPYLTRTLTAERLGTYSYANSIANYFLLFCALGFSISGSREIARSRNNQTDINTIFSKNFFSQCLSSLLSFTAYILFCIISKADVLYYALSLIVLSGFFNISWLYSGLENFKFISIVNSFFKITTAILTILLVKDSNDLMFYTLIMSGGIFGTNFLFFVFHRKAAKIVKVPPREIVLAFKKALVLFIPVVASSVYKLMDKIMIGAITNDMIGVSNYYYAEQLLNIPSGIIIALSSVMLPHMSYAVKNESNEYVNQTARTVMMFTNFANCLITFGLLGVSTKFVPLYLGNEYINCSHYIVFLSISNLFIGWTAMIRTMFLIPKKKDVIYIISVVAGAILNICLNFALIKFIGIPGAILATILSEALVSIIQTVACRKYCKIGLFLFDSFPFLLIGIAMAGLCYYVGQQNPDSLLTIVKQVVVGGSLYLLVSVFYLSIFKKEQYKMLLSFLRKNKNV